MRTPCPISVLPAMMAAAPSAWSRTMATVMGWPPALVMPQASPTGAPASAERCFHRLAATRRCNVPARSTSRGRSPGRSTSPRPSRFPRRSSAGSMPRLAAIMFIWLSPAKMDWGPPMERKEPAPPVWVYTA